MTGPLRLALKYIAYHKLKTVILIACIFLTAFLPIALNTLIVKFNEQIVARAENTPAIVGSLGSQFDLVLHGLYFKNTPPDTIRYAEVQRIRDTGLATPIPIYSRFKVLAKRRGNESVSPSFPIVGTTLDYFDFRGLTIERGSTLAMLGDCVVGSALAERMNLEVGQQLMSTRENSFSITGLAPLKMNVRGILAASKTQDDWSVFVDVKTAWVIRGLGHGHQDAETLSQDDRLDSGSGQAVVAAPSVRPYIEISEANLSSFHFHGDTDDYPLTAVLVYANDQKSETLLLGKYDTEFRDTQMLIPTVVVQELMQTVFQIREFFYLNALLIGFSTFFLLILVILLSLRLRKKEMETMFKIGCNRGTVAMLQAWELAIIFLCAGVLVLVAVYLTQLYSGGLIQSLLIG